MLDRHLFMIGMQGCGKSSLGKRAAREAGIPFADTVALTYARPMIISTGGGTVMNPVNRQIMRSWGTIVLIDRPLEEILGDIKLDRRPTLRDGGLAEVEKRYRERIPVYRELADITLKNNQGYHMAVYTLVRLIRERF